MSSLWTPGGEHPVDPERARQAPAGQSRPTQGPPPGTSQGTPPRPPGNGPDGPDEPDEEEVRALREQLAETPASVVVINHLLGMWELAALHLSQQPPHLDDAALAIDALGAITDRLEGRLGEDEATVRDALAQIRLAFVQIKGAAENPDG